MMLRPRLLLAAPPQYQPHNQDQEKKAADSSSDLGASIVVATSAAGENQNYQHDQDQVHGGMICVALNCFEETGVFEIRKAVSSSLPCGADSSRELFTKTSAD
jgi:hypothetical protein